MFLPKLDFSKIKNIGVDAGIVNVTYKSGAFKRFEGVDLEALLTAATNAGTPIYGVETLKVAAPAPHALAELLVLSTEQAKALEGTTRLNFWRNGVLNVQVEHGAKSIKYRCPEAVATDAQIADLLLGWGWQQLGQKLYFKPNDSSIVRL
jgi:hypothetical protein